MFTGLSVLQCFLSLSGCYLEVTFVSSFIALVVALCSLNFCSVSVAALGFRPAS